MTNTQTDTQTDRQSAHATLFVSVGHYRRDAAYKWGEQWTHGCGEWCSLLSKGQVWGWVNWKHIQQVNRRPLWN